MAALNPLAAGTLAGIAGALFVNVAHETTRRTTALAPRMDIIGMRAFARIAAALGWRPPDHLRSATFAADLAVNSLFYALVATAGKSRALAAGALLGGAAGIGGVLLPPPMRLGHQEVNRTRTTQSLTVAMYLAGGIVAGMAYRAVVKPR